MAFDSGVLTQTTVSELERGKYGPEDLTAARVAALARGLNWSVAELEAATGVNLGLTEGRRSEPREHPIPDTLAEAVRLHGHRFDDLLDLRWQQYLAGFRFRTGSPETPDEWIDLYRDLIRHGITPGGH